MIIEKIIGEIEEYFDEIIISADSKKMFECYPHKVVIDEKTDQGPLMGILSGLRASKNTINFVIACDIPEINISFIEEMITYTNKYDIVVPISGENKFEPLFAFYKKRLIPFIEKLLCQNERKISNLFPMCQTKYIPIESNGWYHNLNTMEDYHDYVKTRKRMV
jgi:molybdopterin-guanine dinucleotide biosynthesis protein A